MIIPPLKKKLYGVGVRFYQRGSWSKIYVYKSHEYYDRNDIVLVRKGTFYSLAKVVKSKKNYDFKSTIKYSFIIQKVEVEDDRPSG